MTMTEPIRHPEESPSNAARDQVARFEPRTLRTYTPTQAVLAHSAGVYHWTPEGRRLYDFTSGVLVANLGHNPSRWQKRLSASMGWDGSIASKQPAPAGFDAALPLTAYNAVTTVETTASRRLVDLLQQCAGGKRLEQAL